MMLNLNKDKTIINLRDVPFLGRKWKGSITGQDNYPINYFEQIKAIDHEMSSEHGESGMEFGPKFDQANMGN